MFADYIGDQKIKNVENDVALSWNTVMIMRMVEGMANNMTEQIKFSVSACNHFSLAINRSWDAMDTAQLSVFTRYVNEFFVVTEELVSIN